MRHPYVTVGLLLAQNRGQCELALDDDEVMTVRSIARNSATPTTPERLGQTLTLKGIPMLIIWSLR